jgi:sugar phosphate isomerase/epimerase
MIDRLKKLHHKVDALVTPSRVVFHHVPKCGGTSVGRALRKRYILSQATVKPEESFRAFAAYTGRVDREQMLVDVASLREQMMLYHLYDDVRCVSLHVPFSDVAYAHFNARYKFITILREPVSRFVSHYFWSYGKPDAHARIEEDFEAFLGTARARRLGASYVEYYSGAPMAPDLADPELIARAIGNLHERFDVVGRLDDLVGFQAKLRQTLGVRIKVGHENKARQPQATRKTMVTPELMARAREVCAPDIAVWDAMFGAGGADD